MLKRESGGDEAIKRWIEAELNSFAHLVREFGLFSISSEGAITGEISIIRLLVQKK